MSLTVKLIFICIKHCKDTTIVKNTATDKNTRKARLPCFRDYLLSLFMLETGHIE